MAALAAYYGISLGVTTSAQSLLALLGAVEPALLEVQQNCAALRVQAANSNETAIVYLGDANVSSSRRAYELLLHDQVPYESPANLNIPLRAIYVVASGSATINVEVVFT